MVLMGCFTMDQWPAILKHLLCVRHQIKHFTCSIAFILTITLEVCCHYPHPVNEEAEETDCMWLGQGHPVWDGGAGLWASPAALGTALSGSALGGGLTPWLSQLPSTCFPRAAPVRGSQGAPVTLFKTEFYFSSWKGWEDDIDCEVRGPDYFLPLVRNTSSACARVPTSRPCSTSTNNRVLWLKTQVAHKSAPTLWNKCSYITHTWERNSS